MDKLSNTYTVRLTKTQKETLSKLEKYNIKISAFIRIAIAEKIKRDYKKIKENKPKNSECPF